MTAQTFPTIRFAPDEIQSGVIARESLLTALALFAANGCLLLENAFSPSLMADLNVAFREKYSPYFKDSHYPDALTLSRGRYQVTVTLDAPFNTAAIYANPLVLPIIRMLLGKTCVIDSFGATLSIPGAEEQRPHRDFPGLFGDQKLDSSLPNYALTFYAPLVGLNETNGTTRMWPGSHRQIGKLFDETDPFADPLAPLGSCLLMDYRTQHKGLANRSTDVRPILYLVYKRPWWSDCANFNKQNKLDISDENLKKIPDEYRVLFPAR